MYCKSSIHTGYRRPRPDVAASSDLAQGVQKVTSAEGHHRVRPCPTVCTCSLFPDTSKPKVTVNMTYLIGSRQEGSGETGMAHLLETHVCSSRLRAAGTSSRNSPTMAPTSMAPTEDDRTNYFETVTATDENLRWAIGLEADRMVKMRMEKALLDTEMDRGPQRV